MRGRLKIPAAMTLALMLTLAAVYFSGDVNKYRKGESEKKIAEYTPLMVTLDEVFGWNKQMTATLAAERVTTLIASGDVMLGRSVNMQAIKYNSFRWTTEKTADWMKKADYTLINLEGPLVEGCVAHDGGMVFCGDPRHAEALVKGGVDIANIANNHSYNFEEKGLTDTKKIFGDKGIKVSGEKGATIVTIKGKRWAFLGYNDIGSRYPGVSQADKEVILKEVAEAKKEADMAVVSLHAGVEYTTRVTERQKELAHAAVDGGADLVIGHHPHWVQPVEIYKGKVIVYSHGNFIFDQMWSEETRHGVAGKYYFYDDQLIGVEWLPVVIEDYGQPRIANKQEAATIMEMMKNGSWTSN